MSREKAMYEAATGRTFTPEEWEKIRKANAKAGGPTSRDPSAYSVGSREAPPPPSPKPAPQGLEHGFSGKSGSVSEAQGAASAGADGKSHSSTIGDQMDPQDVWAGQNKKYNQWADMVDAERDAEARRLEAQKQANDLRGRIDAYAASHPAPQQSSLAAPMPSYESGMAVVPQNGPPQPMAGSLAAGMREDTAAKHYMGEEYVPGYSMGMTNHGSYDEPGPGKPTYRFGDQHTLGSALMKKKSKKD